MGLTLLVGALKKLCWRRCFGDWLAGYCGKQEKHEKQEKQENNSLPPERKQQTTACRLPHVLLLQITTSTPWAQNNAENETYGVSKRIKLLSKDRTRLSPAGNTAIKDIKHEPEWDTPHREPQVILVVRNQIAHARKDRECTAGSVTQRDHIREIEVSKKSECQSRSRFSFRK